MMTDVLIPLADGFEDIEAITAIDVLRRGGVEVTTASLGESRSVRSAHGIVIEADTTLDDVGTERLFSAVLLPGGGEGTENLKADMRVTEILRRHNDTQRLLCAICAAPTVLCAAGVAHEDLQITCYPTCVLEIDRQCADAPVVADGNLITGNGPGASLLFALVVLKTLAGESVALKVQRGMVADVM